MKSYKTQKAELGDKVTKQGTPRGAGGAEVSHKTLIKLIKRAGGAGGGARKGRGRLNKHT